MEETREDSGEEVGVNTGEWVGDTFDNCPSYSVIVGLNVGGMNKGDSVGGFVKDSEKLEWDFEDEITLGLEDGVEVSCEGESVALKTGDELVELFGSGDSYSGLIEGEDETDKGALVESGLVEGDKLVELLSIGPSYSGKMGLLDGADETSEGALVEFDIVEELGDEVV